MILIKVKTSPDVHIVQLQYTVPLIPPFTDVVAAERETEVQKEHLYKNPVPYGCLNYYQQKKSVGEQESRPCSPFVIWDDQYWVVTRSGAGDTVRPYQIPSQYRCCPLPLSLHQIIWASCRTGPILLLLVHFYGYSMFTVQYAQIQNLPKHATRNNEPEAVRHERDISNAGR